MSDEVIVTCALTGVLATREQFGVEAVAAD